MLVTIAAHGTGSGLESDLYHLLTAGHRELDTTERITRMGGDVMDVAREVMEQHGEAINARDVEAYRRTMHFPFTYQNYNGVALTIDNAAACGVSAPLPWEIIVSTDPDWHHTTFDNIEEVARSVSSVVCKVEFSRVDVSGHAYGSYRAIWIATCQNGRWGVQFRHNLGRCEQ